MDYDRGSSNPVFGENSPTQELKISQEEADYQVTTLPTIRAFQMHHSRSFF